MLEATSDGILVTDDRRRVITLNERFAKLWNLSPGAIASGQHQRVLAEVSRHFDRPEAFLERIEAIYRETPAETHDLLRPSDGRVVERYSRIQVLDGIAAGRVWSFRDVTERVRAQLDQSRLAAIVQSSHDVVVGKSLQGIIETWNAEAERVFGWSAAEAIGQPITLIVPPERREEEERIMARLRRGERVEHFETVRVAKDGHRIDLSVTISPIRDAEGHVVGASKVARDVTERKRAEELLRESDRRKDEFLAVLSHELRNPLATLRNGLEILRLCAAEDEASRDTRAMMERQLGHLVRLVDDLLDVSRISRGKLELRRARVPLRDVLSGAIELAGPAIQTGRHQLVVSFPPESIELEADPTRLAQVFANLLNNAAKYTEPGGRIRLAAERRANEVVVTVADSGMGIPAEALPTIFGLFSQVQRGAERAPGGLGIGLALAKGLVEMHGGTVTAASEGQGKGSTFTVSLPMSRSGAEGEFPRRAAAPLAHLVGRRILVADDDRDSAESLALMLRLFGNEVVTVHDGVEAEAEAERMRPDLLLIDVGMPLRSGYEATRGIRAQPWGADVVIVAVTGWGQESDREQSRVSGCDGHLIKPIDLEQLDKLLAGLERA
jgi:PAS domain S-box-containing protein